MASFTMLNHEKTPETQWKIALPRSMLASAIRWYHLVTGCSGLKRLRLSMWQIFYHVDLRKEIYSFKCSTCQKHKLSGKGYGLFPGKELRSEPFEEAAVDFTGPWKVQIC